MTDPRDTMPAPPAPLADDRPSERLSERLSERHRQFRAVMALMGMAHVDFAEALGVHKNHLYHVLRGVRRSQRVNAAIDAVIAAHLPALRLAQQPTAADEEVAA